jgi:carbon starvation protein CstA
MPLLMGMGSIGAISIMMIIYGFITSVLPVLLLLAPRDYLSTFLKVGTILAHAWESSLWHRISKCPA